MMTDYKKAWIGFMKTEAYGNAMKALNEKGIKSQYANNILRCSFDAGMRAKDEIKPNTEPCRTQKEYEKFIADTEEQGLQVITVWLDKERIRNEDIFVPNGTSRGVISTICELKFGIGGWVAWDYQKL